MTRQKRSCDYERPSACHRVAVRRIVAKRARDGFRHTSQYCEEHHPLALADVPKGWKVVSDEPMAVPA